MTRSNTTSAPGLGGAIATLGAILGTLLVNTLSNFFPLGGQSVGEIANTVLDGVMVTPADYAFIIWGVIYLGIIAYGLYQLGPSQRRDPAIRRASRCLMVACLAQIVWIVLFTQQLFSLSILAMLGILLALIGAYLSLGVGRRPANWQRRWFAHYPFSVYLGWISVATVVNIAAPLYVLGWSGWRIRIIEWTEGMILLTAVLGAIVILTRRDIPFTLVLIWAYTAIAVRHYDIVDIWRTALIASLALLALLVGWRWWTGRSRRAARSSQSAPPPESS